eukprot:scaffold152526_cov18-Tisochrysis_lutea.AAC.1
MPQWLAQVQRWPVQVLLAAQSLPLLPMKGPLKLPVTVGRPAAVDVRVTASVHEMQKLSAKAQEDEKRGTHH